MVFFALWLWFIRTSIKNNYRILEKEVGMAIYLIKGGRDDNKYMYNRHPYIIHTYICTHSLTVAPQARDKAVLCDASEHVFVM